MVTPNGPGRRCDASGEICLTAGLAGSQCIITAPAARFDVWKQDGTFERINASLNESNRKRVEKMPTPSLVCVDSQSVKLSPMICEERGLDPNKRINGRKRHLVVDTQGRLLVAHVHAANEADGPAACALIGDVLWRVGERLEKVMGDQAASAVRLQRGIRR